MYALPGGYGLALAGAAAVELDTRPDHLVAAKGIEHLVGDIYDEMQVAGAVGFRVAGRLR